MYYGYARVSTEAQNDASLNVQHDYLKKCAEKLNQEFYAVSEKASGKDIEGRPEFQRLLRDIKEGDYLGVYDNSRLGRNTEDNLKVAKELKSRGVLLQINGKIVDLDDPQELMLLTIESGISTYFRGLQLDKIKKGIHQKHASGNRVYKDDLLGYNLIKQRGVNHISINEEEAKKVRYIFERYAAETQIKDIAAAVLNVKEYTRFWNEHERIKDILRNPIYIGYYYYEGKLIKSNFYPPIIEEELFWRCQELINARKKKTTRVSKQLCSGVFRCPVCDSHMHNSASAYVMRHYDNCPQISTHQSLTFYTPLLDAFIKASYYITFSSGDDLEEFCREQRENILLTKSDLQEEINSYKKDLKEVDEKARKMFELAISSSFKDIFNEEMSKLETTKKEIEKKIKEVEAAFFYQQGLEDDLYEQTSKNMLEEKSRVSLLKTLKEAYIGKDKSFHLTYKNGRWFEVTGYPLKKGKTVKKYELTMLSGGKFADHWIKIYVDEALEEPVRFEWIDQEDSFSENESFSDYVNDVGRKKVEEINEFIKEIFTTN